MSRVRHYKITSQRVGNTTYKTVQSRRTAPYGPPGPPLTTKQALASGATIAVITAIVWGVFVLIQPSQPNYTVTQMEQHLSAVCADSQITTLPADTVPSGATATVSCTMDHQSVDVFLFKTNGATTQGQAQMHFSACAQVEGGNWLADIQCGTTDTAFTIGTQIAQRVQKVLGGAVQ